MIQGVQIKKLSIIPDERGRLMEIMRCDESIFQGFGQVYLTTNYPGVVKAWHFHKKQTDMICCVRGMIKAVLYDARSDSPTHREIMELYLGDHNHILLSIPPGVYHGWKCISAEESLIISIPTEPYRYQEPDEFRLPPDSPDIPYDWILTPGKKHG